MPKGRRLQFLYFTSFPKKKEVGQCLEKRKKKVFGAFAKIEKSDY